MAAVKSKDTGPELIVRRLIHKLGYRYRLHVRELPGTPDLVFPSRRKIILVSGCFWHGHSCGRCRLPSSRRAYWVAKIDRNKRRDRMTAVALRQLGWQVWTIWECQLRNVKRLQKRATTFLSQRS
jgi:DNA mismatch endonuclease (patch repair protein)